VKKLISESFRVAKPELLIYGFWEGGSKPVEKRFVVREESVLYCGG